ncbi:GNAT family N-acetyltransferase [Halopseudomonas nanhaiensis]|uniref:GNAT family N-acetyltransferase n=1 Tax=Halopseudomonas nanhaiensis TaxID=2830842 RepID=UPI001CBFCB79|nr:GNAT family N-acetyltransferase [Halopseudomonas nanhaiensis]UAW98569.1 GNAT family N-acetyltransferase [Halopseudomonas nanhaiensis]
MIRDVMFPDDAQELNSLIREYVEWLNIDLSYQDFEGEMARIESVFTLPRGLYTFVIVNSKVAGGVGFRHIDPETAEVKRLYVRPQYQGLALGRALMNSMLDKLASLGYRRVVLDAVPPTVHAQSLYVSMGFHEIDPYFDNPTPDTKFYGIELNASHRKPKA